MEEGKMRPTRFAHIQGHTNVCYSDDGKYIITCGLDGDVRLFESLDDDNCITFTVADCTHCIAYRDNCALVGTDLNMVQSFTLDEGKPCGIITRFTALPTHIQVSSDKSAVAVAASDMTIKVHDFANFKDLEFIGHEAPVLSVALDPIGDFLASSSCDGTVRIWNFRTQSVVRSFPLISKCNDINFSKTLCRINFTPSGTYFVVPVDSEIVVYNRNTWKVEFKLQHSTVDSIISITAISPCGTYVAGGCRNGRIVIWSLKTKSCILTEKPSSGMAVTGLVWNPIGKDELAFVNNQGELGTVEHIFDTRNGIVLDQSSAVEKQGNDETVNIAEKDDFHPFGDGPFEDEMPEEDENEYSLAKIKSQLGFADDEEGTFLGIPEKKESVDGGSRAPSRVESLPAALAMTPKLPEAQKPFQPGMSPEHLNDRYMVWNNTGIVRQYRGEEESSIEVEFHDSSIHHPLHLNNHIGHCMAALNNQALVLAAESQGDQLSKLVVHHFSAWDGSKEWEIDMPEGEDILAVTLGSCWVAAATDKRNLRIFSTSGVQRDLLSIPGPVVCLSGWEDYIMVAYHSGMGVLGEQSISSIILNFASRKHPMPSAIQVPLSPASYLSWAGFTDEGNPIIMDSAGMVKIFTQKMGHMWTCFLDTKQFVKGKSDHYFLIGANEVQGVIRCILCKGSRYPPVLPRPHVTLLEFKMPLCEPHLEKGMLEENLLRTRLLTGTVGRLSKQGFDVEATELEIEKKLRENMLKLFALACRSDRESRALELCETLPSYDMIDLAVKYASKTHRMQLAERLNEVVQRKMEEKWSEEDEERAFHRSQVTDQDEDHIANSTSHFGGSQQTSYVEDTEDSLMKRNPLLAASAKRNSRDSVAAKSFEKSFTIRNPFRKSQIASGSSRGLELLDNMKNSKKAEIAPVLKPVVKKVKSKQTVIQSSVIPNRQSVQAVGKENKCSNEDSPMDVVENTSTKSTLSTLSSAAVRKPSALKLWLEDNRKLVEEKFPGATESELLVKAALLFKDVDDAEKQKYKNLATKTKEDPIPVMGNHELQNFSVDAAQYEENKRKPDATTELDEPAVKKQKSGIAKLSAFAFSKNS